MQFDVSINMELFWEINTDYSLKYFYGTQKMCNENNSKQMHVFYRMFVCFFLRIFCDLQTDFSVFAIDAAVVVIYHRVFQALDVCC